MGADAIAPILMHISNQSRRTTKAFAILMAIASLSWSHLAFADYVAFQSIWPSAPNSLDDAMFGGGNGARIDFHYSATSTVTLFDRVIFAVCRQGGTEAGRLDLELRTYSTSTDVLASSTVSVSNTTVAPCDGSGNTGATTTTFELNRTGNWSEGTQLWFSIYPRNVTGSFLFTSHTMDDVSPENFDFYVDNVKVCLGSCGLATTFSASMMGRADGLPPPPSVNFNYNASSTTIVCETFEIDCYITRAFVQMFYPSVSITLLSETPTIASTSPFSYLYEIGDIWDNIFTGTATGTQTLTLSFSPLGMATTTITAGTLSASTFGHTFFSTVRNWIEIFLYLAFAFGIFRIALGLIGWTHLADGPSGAGNTATRAVNVTKGVYNRFKL